MTGSLLMLLAALQQPATAFVDVNVVDVERGRVIERQTVIVDNGRITAVGAVASTRVPAGATRIDGRGKFLIPGLGDAHLHFTTPNGGPALAARAMRLSAQHGVTMGRGMYTEAHHQAAADSALRGEFPGPRLLLVSPALSGQNASQPAAAAELVRRHHAAGYRVIKILPGIPRESFDSISAAARQLGVPLSGHVPLDVGLELALRSGYQSLEHLDGIMEALMPAGTRLAPQQVGFFGMALVEQVDTTRLSAVVAAIRAANVTIVPTEVSMEQFAARANPQRSPRFQELRRRMIVALHRAGVPIAAGSDAYSQFDEPGTGLWHEMETLVAAGLSPRDVLAAATINVARLVGLEHDAGVIAVGRTADLVLLDADPLRDISAVRQQAGVMLRGRWLGRDR